MTLNLTELKDEPLGKHHILEASCWSCRCFVGPTPDQTEQQVAAAVDGEGVFKIDVDGLSDEVLAPGYTVSQFSCSTCGATCCFARDTGGRDGA